jgi:signal transduction histidine kinase/CheY-like chemotaxis protein
VRGDGTVGWILSRGRVERDDTGRPVRLFGNTIDVTELREAQQRLADALQRLELASDAARIGVWERDLRSLSGWWDPSVMRLHGLPDDAPPPGREAVLDLVHPQDRAAWREAFEGALQSETGLIDVRYRVNLAGGELRWVHSRGRTVRGPDGTPERQIGVAFDVTREHQAELAERARELAERASAAKTEFLSRMSHELRTPLNAVTGFAQLLMHDAREPVSAAQRAKLEHIARAGWHLARLIDDILDLARAEGGQARINPATVALAPLLRECAEAARTDAAAAGIQLLVPPMDERLHAWCDRTRTRQVLTNLISNAIKYNRPGGQVRVDVALGADGWPRLSVADTGLGMDETQLAQLFQPFNRLGREGGDTPGHGIGLALSKSLVEIMGGRLEVRSHAGEGSVFHVVLPLPPSAAPSAEAVAAAPGLLHAQPSVSGRLLVVEDVASNVELLLRMLELRPGLEVRVAGSGAAALSLAAAWQADLALLDLRLPDIDGIALAARLRQTPGWQATPMVCVTADSVPALAGRIAEAGFVDTWRKPLKVDEVLAALDRLLGA